MRLSFRRRCPSCDSGKLTKLKRAPGTWEYCCRACRTTFRGTTLFGVRASWGAKHGNVASAPIGVDPSVVKALLILGAAAALVVATVVLAMARD